MKNFANKVVKWFKQHGRTHLPWQQEPAAYHVWVSEIMLQQTQVATVIPYYERFMKRFPCVEDLAAASIDEVLHHWAGLGYYARGRNLHKAAQIVVAEHGGKFPETVERLVELPGIGRSTAGAIRSLGHHQRATILDGNVKRVLVRFYAIEAWPEERNTLKKLWELADSLTPSVHIEAYNQAMMDLGATVCTRSKPNCGMCPLNGECQALAKGMTQDLPVRRPKKILPQKSGKMIILLRQDGAILLNKRPSSGIWGGLWCFPEPDQLPIGLSSLNKRILGISRHTFTHYRWEIDLECWAVSGFELTSLNNIWYTPTSQPLGLAAIVKRYLPMIISEEA
jgi:A/G-specific adenine glycosylase